MFILLPTCDTHGAVAEISAALLARYWPAHPPLHVLHYTKKPQIPGAELHDCGRQDQNPWLATVAGFLRARDEELFVLMLDDYGMCGPARAGSVGDAGRLMREDESVGLFGLGWYPAAGRAPRPGRPGVVTLTGAPVLLQAALWRRSWFLDLAAAIDPRASPWGFEAAATQAARRIPGEVCAAEMPIPEYLGGHFMDGFDKTDWPLPYHNLMHRGELDERHEVFLRAQGFAAPHRGLGDTLAALARASGAAKAAELLERATGRPCGCSRRRRMLNEWVSYE